MILTLFNLLEHIHVWRQRNYDVAVQTFRYPFY